MKNGIFHTSSTKASTDRRTYRDFLRCKLYLTSRQETVIKYCRAFKIWTSQKKSTFSRMPERKDILEWY